MTKREDDAFLQDFVKRKCDDERFSFISRDEVRLLTLPCRYFFLQAAQLEKMMERCNTRAAYPEHMFREEIVDDLARILTAHGFPIDGREDVRKHATSLIQHVMNKLEFGGFVWNFKRVGKMKFFFPIREIEGM